VTCAQYHREDFDDLPTEYPYTLMIPQDITEQLLLERLRSLGGQVRRPCELTGLTQDAGGVTATMATGDTIRATYVVGADGMHSTVREHTGIGFTGDTYAQSFVLADVHMDWHLPETEVMLYYSPAGLVVLSALPGGRHRIVATVDDAPGQPGGDFVQALLDARGPERRPARIRDVVWSSRFRVHHRLADHYRAGRLFLAGDAAHVHSPAGGQGMNTGIQDAVALARRLTAVLGHGAADTVLDEYETERRPVAAEVVALTDRITRIATIDSVPLRTARNALLHALLLGARGTPHPGHEAVRTDSGAAPRRHEMTGGSGVRKLTVTANVTLDGVMQAPGRPDEDTRDGFTHGGWALPYDDRAKAEAMGRATARAHDNPKIIMRTALGWTRRNEWQPAYAALDLWHERNAPHSGRV
jgi:2-polyprenyl-6-methoxyphenol hydroxylase-like FAD-dependent oxidoreductase